MGCRQSFHSRVSTFQLRAHLFVTQRFRTLVWNVLLPGWHSAFLSQRSGLLVWKGTQSGWALRNSPVGPCRSSRTRVPASARRHDVTPTEQPVRDDANEKLHGPAYRGGPRRRDGEGVGRRGLQSQRSWFL